MSEKQRREKDGGEVVYRRLPATNGTDPGEGVDRPTSAGILFAKDLAPTLRPLLIGFVLLLVLIGLLGLASMRELESVEEGTKELQSQHRYKISQLLDIHAAAIKLNSEARIRSASELREENRSPFNMRLQAARVDVESKLALLERMPFANETHWRSLREHLVLLLETTKDLKVFNLDGFAHFRDFEKEVSVIQADLIAEPARLAERSAALRVQSAKQIRFWWITALLIGLAVVSGTIWEVQRRYSRERKSIEDAKRERQFSTQMLEGMVSAIAAIDAHGQIRSGNASFFGLFPDAYVGASVHDKLATPEARKMLEIAFSQRESPAGYRGRWMLGPGENSSGRPISCDIYSSPLEIDGEQGQIVTLVDVSDAVETESVLRRTEALAAVGQASAQVAHEIRNPLGSIRLGVTMLRDMIEGKEALNTIDLVERGIDHLNKLVVDVTQFSREKPLSRSPVDLHKLLESSAELVADRIGGKHQRIEKRLSSDLLRGEWDQDQLRQVFVNLLANASDASKENSALIISTEHLARVDGTSVGEQSPDKPEIARVTVIDQGDGMDEPTRSRIFEPFFTTKKRGTGLGLAIVKQIVDRHGGTITVQSEPGKGTQFVIELPLKATGTVNPKPMTTAQPEFRS